LTDESIKGYGSLLHTSQKKPTFENEQFVFTGDIYKYNANGTLTAGILIGKKREMKLECLEQHAETQEILVQLENDAIIFLAKTSEKGNGPGEAKAFYLKQGEAVALDKGIWHWVPFPFECDCCKTLVIFKDGTSERDCEIKNV
jgi:ureidoglycolate hydrolase